MPGVLSYTPDHGLQLQLFGSFKGDFRPPWMEQAEGHPIWGEVSGFAGRPVPVSLFKEIATNRPNDPNAPEKPASHDIFYVNEAVVGTHAIESEALNFTQVEVSVPDLESFVGTVPFHPLPTQEGAQAIGVVYQAIEPIEVRFESTQMGVSIVSIADQQHSLYDCRFTMTYRYVIELTPASPLAYAECMKAVFKLINFFALCSHEEVHVRRLKGVLDTGENVAWFARARRRKRKPTPNDWLLTLKEIERHQFSSVLNNWFELEDKLGFMGDVFFSELGAPSHVTDARFFHFVGCLEAYHRDVVRSDAGKYLSKAEFQAVRAEIMAHVPTTLPKALISSMKGALSHANDFSFGERVQELFESLDVETRNMLVEDHQRFLAALKHSRHRMAHVSDKDDREKFQDREYAHANIVVRAWMVLLLLKRCGVPEQVIQERMQWTGYLFWGPFRFTSPPTP